MELVLSTYEDIFPSSSELDFHKWVMYMSWTHNSDGLMTIGKCGLMGDLLLLLLLLLLVVLEAVCGCRNLNI
jgi:hypothetical protein